MAAYDRSEFALEREKLIGEIAENLARCVSNVNQLNRNIENVALVGTGFHQVNMLWKQFENTMSETAPSIPQHEAGEIISLPTRVTEDEADVISLTLGAAPGGGGSAEI